jgi:Response regulators consisting of a CheY-like receiver domain and a winged-helix DNA-binding domain
VKKILLVEDNELYRILVKEVLEMDNYQIRVVNDGEEALSALKSESFDLVLTDIALPKLNGIELTQKIREQEKKQPKKSRQKIIAMTADLQTKDGKSFEEIDFDGFIQKPFKIQDFRNYVESIIGSL